MGDPRGAADGAAARVPLPQLRERGAAGAAPAGRRRASHAVLRASGTRQEVITLLP